VRVVRVAVGFGVLLVALCVQFLVGLYTILATCQVSDVASRVPAPASVQGRICDRQDHWLNAMPYVVLAGSVVIAVVLAVVWWDTTRRWLGVTACLWLAPLSALALALPPDTCSSDQAADEPRWACSTVGNG
jgi:hypothetical protein